MSRIKLPNNWRPRAYQLAAWRYLEHGGKHAELIWHRRSGKDEICLHHAACKAFERVAGYWHMLPEAAQARKAIWDAIDPHTGQKRIDKAFPREIRKTTRNQEMQIEFINGSSWQVVGSDNFDSLVGSTPAGITYSEWALSNPNARSYLRPIIAENNGWQLFISTPRGRNHAYTTLKSAEKDPRAYTQILPATQTGVFTDEQLDQELQSYIDDFGSDYGTARFEQEYLCSFDSANLGAILAGQLGKLENQGLINDDVEFDPYGSEIFISADIGRRDSATWFFWQPKLGGYSIIDYDGGWGIDADDWCYRLQDKIAKYRLHNGKTALGKIYLPHDARAKTFAAKHSAMEIFTKHFGPAHVAITPNSSISDRVNAARKIVQRCEFHATNCEQGLNGLRAWSYEYDDNSKIFSSQPKHDWACLVGESLVKTQGGDVRIDYISIGDFVETPMGYLPVIGLHEYLAKELIEITLADSRKVTCTGNHKWFTSTGLVYGDELCYNDVLFSGNEISWKLISLISTVAGITDIHQAITDSHQQGSKEKKELRQGHIIETYGSFITELYRKEAKFIIKMKTKAITALKTLSALLGQSISHCMAHQAEKVLQNGIEQKKEKSFIANKGKRTGKMTGMEVLNALKKPLNLEGIRRQNGTKARQVKNGTESKANRHGKTELFTRKIALFAIKNLLRLGRIEAITVGRIVGLKRLDSEQKVYDLTVQDHHMYKANGVLSSNSHDGDGFSYGCLIISLFKPPENEIVHPKFWEQQTLNELWNDRRPDKRL